MTESHIIVTGKTTVSSTFAIELAQDLVNEYVRTVTTDGKVALHNSVPAIGARLANEGLIRESAQFDRLFTQLLSERLRVVPQMVGPFVGHNYEIAATGQKGSLMDAQFDQIFKSIVTAEWCVKSDGDVESPVGYYSLTEVPATLGERQEMADAVEVPLADMPPAGWYVTTESNSGIIMAYLMTSKTIAEVTYELLDAAYQQWYADTAAEEGVDFHHSDIGSGPHAGPRDQCSICQARDAYLANLNR